MTQSTSFTVSLAPTAATTVSGPVYTAVGPVGCSFSGPVPALWGRHNTPAHSGPIAVAGSCPTARVLYTVRPSDSTLMRFDGEAWGPVVQLDPEAARAWSLGYSVNYSLTPHMSALLIVWCNGKLQETVTARYAEDGLTITSRVKGAELHHTGQLVLGEPLNSGGHIVFVATAAERYIVDVGCGDSFTVLKRNDNTVFAWGDNTYGKATVPRELENVDLLAVGAHHTIVQQTNGSLVAWGQATTETSPLSPLSTPVTAIPAGLSNTIQISAGSGWTAALRQDNTVALWGDMHTFNADYAAITALTNVVEISAGAGHLLWRLSDDTVGAAGDDAEGQVSNLPPGLTAINISAGSTASYAVRPDGTVVGWGSSLHGLLDIPPDLEDVKRIEAGDYMAYAIKTNGTVAGWGSHQQDLATTPKNLRDPLALSAGRLHSAFVLHDFSLHAWGENKAGESNAPNHSNSVFYVQVDSDWTTSVIRDTVSQSNETPRTTAVDQCGSAAALAAQFTPHGATVFRHATGYGQNPEFVVPGLTSNWLKDPSLMADTVVEWGNWWLDHGFDPATGRWYTRMNREGVVSTQRQRALTQSRNVYALSKAFLISGDTKFLVAGKKALEYQYDVFWDPVHGGWNPDINTSGVLVVSPVRWSFMEHYCLLGYISYYEATRDPTILDIYTQGQNLNDTNLWDSRPGFEGYYDFWYTDGRPPAQKGFTPTVDAISTNHLYGALVLNDPAYIQRFRDLADQACDHLVASMDDPITVFGFVSDFTEDWEIPDPITAPSVSIGHMLKTVWILSRAGMYFRDMRYVECAEKVAKQVLEYDAEGPNAAWDYTYNGPYNAADFTTGLITSQNKDWWGIEQAFTGLITLWHVTGQAIYLTRADEALKFFEDHIVDPVYGEVYHTVGPSGLPVVNSNKSTEWKNGYHSVETVFLGYLYASLYLYGKDVSLFYQFEAEGEPRALTMNVVEILNEAGLIIRSVELDGVEYTDFQSAERILNIPAGVGGIFKITYGTDIRYGVGRHIDIRSYVSAPVGRQPHITPAVVPADLDFGGLSFYEWARLSDRHDPWPRMILAALSHKGTILLLGMDGFVYRLDRDYRTYRPVIDLVQAVDMAPKTLLTQMANPEAGNPYDGGSFIVNENELEAALGNWRGGARVRVHTSSDPFYPVDKQGRITWDRRRGRLEIVAFDWEDSFSRDVSGPLGNALGYTAARHPSVPIPEGTVLEVSPCLFGPLDSRDSNCRTPICGYAFEAEGLVWFVYLSGDSNPTRTRHPSFMAAFSLDEAWSPSGGLYIPLDVGGHNVNADGASFTYDDKTRTLSILYEDPAQIGVYMLQVGITSTSATPLHYSLVSQAATGDPRSLTQQGNLASYEPGQTTALITHAVLRGDKMEGHATVLLTGPTGQVGLNITFATEDNPVFRPVTLKRRRSWMANPGGRANMFTQDLLADGVDPQSTKMQYRVQIVEPGAAGVCNDPLMDLYVEGMVHGCDLGVNAIRVNSTNVALLFGADNALYQNAVQYRKTDGPVLVAAIRLSEAANYQLEVCHNSPELSTGSDGATMWIVPHNAPTTAVICSANAEPGEIVKFGACALEGGGTSVVVGTSACVPGTCVPAASMVCEYYLEVCPDLVPDGELSTNTVVCSPPSPPSDSGWVWEENLCGAGSEGWYRLIITEEGCPCLEYDPLTNNWVDCGFPEDPTPFPPDDEPAGM